MPVYFKNTSYNIIFGEDHIEKMGGDNVVTYSMYGDNPPITQTVIPFIQTGDITKDNILSFDQTLCNYGKDSSAYTYNIKKFPSIWRKGVSIDNNSSSYMTFDTSGYSSNYEDYAWTPTAKFEIIFIKPMLFKKVRFTYRCRKESVGCTTNLYNNEIVFSDRFLEYKYASWAIEGDEDYGTGQIIIDSNPDKYKVFNYKRTIEYCPNVVSNKLEFVTHGYKYAYSAFEIYAINIEADYI